MPQAAGRQKSVPGKDLAASGRRPGASGPPKRWILNIACLINRRKVYWKYIFGETMKRETQLFFLPGNLTANLLGATAADDRMMIRMLVDMLFWNLVVVAGAWMIFR